MVWRARDVLIGSPRLPLFVALSLWCVLPAACFDTKLIPPQPAEEAGAPTTPGGTSAEAGAAPSGAGAETGGASFGGWGGAPLAGMPSSGSAGERSGGAGEASGGEPTRITWLSLQGSEAPASDVPNRDLRVAGRFYAYADDCAELHWDEASRCAVGQLCDPLGGENWGIAVGFDFNNTGEEGVPANAKLLWDPRQVGALGVAFKIGGQARAPRLQLWVLNMDSVWSGECTAMTCEIAGPPDGRRLLPLEGELWFDDMRKDDWGGAGVRYDYDPAAVYALQFKLPAIEVGPASFSFCVDALGIIR
jgi:hypothetical protein